MPVPLPCPRAGAGRNGADHFPSCYSCDTKHVWDHAAKSKASVKNFHIFQDWDDSHDGPPLFYAKCGACRANFCSLCLRKLYWGATAKARASDSWLAEVSGIIERGPQDKIIYFNPGPCCEIKKACRDFNKDGGENQQRKAMLATLKNLAKQGVKLIDGCCYLQQYGLFLNSPNGCVDIHCFAGVVHCVPNERSVVAAGTSNIYPTCVFQCNDAVVSRVTIPRFDFCGRATGANVSFLCTLATLSVDSDHNLFECRC